MDVPNGTAPCQAAGDPDDVHDSSSATLAGHYMEGVTTVDDLEQALTEAFLRTDEEFCATDGAEYVGSTAVCTLVGSRVLCIANCGDSRAVISRGNGQVVALTDDHKPDREDEKSRVEAAGGQILYWNGRRVMGVLAMSRAIGDQCLQPFVIPDPEITIVQRRDDDELIVMGSDGLWDVLSNEETVQLAKKALKRAREKGASSRAATKIAATVLIRAALSKGSRDNITAIVVDLTSTHDSEDGSGSAPGEGGVAASRGAIARGASADHRYIFKAFDSKDSVNTGSPSTPSALLSDDEHTEHPPSPVMGHYESIELRK
uniref:PPM-type phosphatase domain-containing protein n=1 Tax=Tetraselmis chuii TaxID=63592 RepID=A0A7S1WZX8_9CHLO